MSKISKIFLFVLFIAALGFTNRVTAQPPTPPPGVVSAVGRQVISSTASGSTTTAMYLAAVNNEGMKKDFGFTEEQNRKLRELNSAIQAEVRKNAMSSMERFKNFSPEVERQLVAEVQEGIKKVHGRIDEIVTPAQREKAKTLSFQAFGGLDSPLVNMDMISSLDLNEEQKKKAEKMFQETEKERVEIMEAGLKLAEKAVARGGPGMSAEARAELEAEAKALEGRVYASGRKMGSQIREFLTDAQRKKADELMENRPDYMRRLPRQLRKQKESEEWKPSDSSWEPGQGVESGDTPRSGRFPVRRNAD